jgi:adenosine kinase
MAIVCTGSVAYDYLMKFPGYFKDHILAENLETLSLSFLVESLTRVRGGIAPNIAYTLALLGEKRPIVFATVGEDFSDYRAWLQRKGVETDYIRTIAGEFTASFFASTDRANSQIASFYPGAMGNAKDYSLKELDFTPELVIISPNDPDAMIRYVDECIELDIPYLYDPSQQIVRMNGVDIRKGVESAFSLFVNEYEFQLLLKHTGLTQAEILSRVKFLVITHGNKGSTVFAEGKEFFVPVAGVDRIVDPTGVGDAYRGGFLRGYSLGFDWETCGKMGAVAAAFCLEEKGTQSHHYSVQEFIDRYIANFGESERLNKLLIQYKN